MHNLDPIYVMQRKAAWSPHRQWGLRVLQFYHANKDFFYRKPLLARIRITMTSSHSRDALERFCCTTIFAVLIRTHLIKCLNRILYWWGKIWCVIVLHAWADQAVDSHHSLRHLFFILVVCSLFHDVVCVIMHVYWLLLLIYLCETCRLTWWRKSLSLVVRNLQMWFRVSRIDKIWGLKKTIW